MKKYLKILSGFLILPLCLSLGNPQSVKAADSTDSSFEQMLPDEIAPYKPTDIQGHWAFDYLKNFVNADIIKGYKETDGTYTVKPENNITRAEFVAILVRSLGLTSNQTEKSFTDVTKDQWYYDSVRIASALGIVSGTSDTTFEPERNVKRDELATMIIRAFNTTLTKSAPAKSFSDVPSGYWAQSSILEATKAEIISGYPDGTFQPTHSATRAEAIKMLSVALDHQQNNTSDNTSLTNRVMDLDNQCLQLTQEKKWDELIALEKKDFTGYDLANSLLSLDMFKMFSDEGCTMDIQRTGSVTATVVKKSNLFVQVKLEGAAITFTVSDGDQKIEEMKTPDKFMVYLKKDLTSGVYKVYWYQPLLTADEKSYIECISSNGEGLFENIFNLIDLMMRNDTGTPAWRTSLDDVLGKMEQEISAAKGKTAPTSLNYVQDSYNQALEQLEPIITGLPQALDENNQDQVDAYSNNVIAAMDYLMQTMGYVSSLLDE